MPIRPASRLQVALLVSFSLFAACRDSTEPRDPAATLDVAGTPREVDVGDTVALAIRVLDEGGRPITDRRPVVTSSAPSVLGVLSDGRVVGLGTGTATLHVTTSSGAGPLAADVVVAVARRPRTIVASTRADSLLTGDTLTVFARALDLRGAEIAGTAIRFTSSDSTVLAVDSISGLIAARNDGPATITVRAGAVTRSLLLRGALPRLALPGPARSITMSPFHGCVLVGAGEAYCWGQNGSGQLGNTDILRSLLTTPMAVAGGLLFSSIDADRRGTCGLTTSHLVFCWGEGSPGRATRVPTQVTFGDGSQVAASVLAHGDGGGCIVDATGVAWCWGSNVYFQFGDDPDPSRRTTTVAAPTPVRGDLRWSRYKPGFEHACGITVDRALACVGIPYSGSGLTTTTFTPTVVAPSGPTRSLTLGWRFTCALDDAGVAACGGADEYGQLGHPSPAAFAGAAMAAVSTSLRFVSVKAQYANACALTADGELWCWGKLGRDAIALPAGTNGAPHLFSRDHRFVDFAVGAITACGITAEGDVYCGTRTLGALP